MCSWESALDDDSCVANEIREKGNTRTMIPKRPATAPATHIHIGIEEALSTASHAASGMESAESMVVDYREGGKFDV